MTFTVGSSTNMLFIINPTFAINTGSISISIMTKIKQVNIIVSVTLTIVSFIVSTTL